MAYSAVSLSCLQVAMKEKMLTKLERDRAVGQVSPAPTAPLYARPVLSYK